MACDDPEHEPIEGVLLHDGDLVELDEHHFRAGGGLWVNNGLSDPLVGGIDPDYPLSSPQGLSEQAGVLTDPDTRIVADYLVECALPAGSSVVKQVNGETLVLEGAVGLAPQWEDGECSENCQEWVSACLLARTNVSEENVLISLRASAPSIGFSGNPDFPVYEASFFGNLFRQDPTRYMCRGNAEELAQASLAGRTCSGSPEQCAMVAYDDCMQAERCTFLWDDGYTAVNCKAEGNPKPYRTISVYVHETEGG